jgi:hypothetical protein
MLSDADFVGDKESDPVGDMEELLVKDAVAEMDTDDDGLSEDDDEKDIDSVGEEVPEG